MNNPSETAAWRVQLERTLAKYLKDSSTIYVVVSFYSSLRAIKRSFAGINDTDTRQGVLMILVDNFVSYHSNTFMQMYAPKILPVMQVAIQNMLDSYGYSAEMADPGADQDKKNDIVQKTIATAHSVHEVAIYALLCEQGAEAFISKGRQMRDDLLALEPIINGEAGKPNG